MNPQQIKEFNRAIRYFTGILEAEHYELCDPLTVGAEIMSFITKSYGSIYNETFSTITDTHPRGRIVGALIERYEDRRDEFLDTITNWYYEETKRLRGDEAIREWDENWDKDDDLYYKMAIKTIEDLRTNGYDDLYITNWNFQEELVKQHYFELLERRRLGP